MEQPNVPQSYPPALPQSTLAILSLIAGIGGFTFLPLVGSIIAILTGYAARKETRSVPPTATGDGMATAGIVMGWVQVGLAAVGLCCFGAFLLLAAAGVITGNGQ